MAAAVSCALASLLFLSVVLPQSLCNGNGYYAYTVGRRKTTEEIRLKRYVESSIPRLADDYRSVISKDIGKGDLGVGESRGQKTSMEMLGNVAVKDGSLDHHHPEDQTSSKTPPPTPTKHTESEKEHEEKPIIPPHELPIKPPSVNSSLGDNSAQPSNSTSKPATSSESGNTNYMPTDDYPKDDVSNNNNTLLKNNITEKQMDQHTYYNSTFFVRDDIGKHYWVNLEKERDVTVNEMLSSSHRRAVTVKLRFDFPFYGHTIRNISIATGGFLYTGDYIHSWLAATQYIAPLMANFDTNMSSDSLVKYRDNGTAFTVEWYKVSLQDKRDAGQFTFQVTLHENGNIIFVYKDVPILVDTIEDSLHPVKVGLSDAYIIDRTVFYVRRKTIYEYHRVNFKGHEIRNWTMIYMNALPTCHSFDTCDKCVTQETGFECKWCPALERCSTGIDRMRQQWQFKNCDLSSIVKGQSCTDRTGIAHTIPPAGSKQEGAQKDVPQVATVVAHTQEESNKSASFAHTGMMGLLLFILLVTGIGLWALYAYRNPHTLSGQVLIKYRPSQWTLRRGEARYTAASIHM